MSEPFSVKSLNVWVAPDGEIASKQALGILRSLHILEVVQPDKTQPQAIQLTANFKKSLRLALEGGGSHNSFGVPSSLPVDPHINIAFLDNWAGTIWHTILYYVVDSFPSTLGQGPGRSRAAPKLAVKGLLEAGGLVRVAQGGQTQISERGFNFLLQEANAQVWSLLLLWLEAIDRLRAENKEAVKQDNVETLSFLFMLASLELGRAYDTSALTEIRKNMLPFLSDVGLIYIDPNNKQQYFPTRLATTLTSSSSTLRSVVASFDAAVAKTAGDASSLMGNNPSSTHEETGIIVETNYRLYAYTSSPLQIAMLSLFCRLNMRWPNMVTAQLTRESVHQAVANGITANQIISYLAAHAHPQMRRQAAVKGTQLLPPTVVDQIRLWQLECERMTTTPGFLFKDFDTVDEYREMSLYAQEIGVLVWKSDRTKMFFASKVEPLRDWLKMRKKGN